MERKKKERTDTLYVVDDTGNRYKVVEYTNYEEVAAFGKPSEWIELIKEYRTIDGNEVNRKGENEFEVPDAFLDFVKATRE